MRWDTKLEKEVIKRYGGQPLKKYGYDGKIRGKPVEVRAARRDNRFRIQKNVHRHLVANGGSYIFCANGKSKKVPAKEVSQKIGRGKWFKDRKYPHKFLNKKQIF